jgi:hypothetical protein
MVMIPDLIDLEDNLDAPIPERFAQLAEELRAEGHDEPMVRKIVRAVGGTGFNLNLFPNVACSMAFFRVLRPVSVDETEIQHVAIGMGDAASTPSPAGNRARLRLHEHFQGPMGFGTPDDAEGWERVQRGAQAGDDLWIMLNRGGCPRRACTTGAQCGRCLRSGHARGLSAVEEDDDGMSIAFEEATRFIWAEADMLDRLDYKPWLALWTAEGTYTIPVDHDGQDFDNQLNVVHDNATMRAARVKRLTSGFSMSSAPPAHRAHRLALCRHRRGGRHDRTARGHGAGRIQVRAHPRSGRRPDLPPGARGRRDQAGAQDRPPRQLRRCPPRHRIPAVRTRRTSPRTSLWSRAGAAALARPSCAASMVPVTAWR